MRGMCHHWIVIGVLTVVVALVASSAAQAGPAPPQLGGVRAAQQAKSTDSSSGQFSAAPDWFERAVIRSQADPVLADSHDRQQAGTGSGGADVLWIGPSAGTAAGYTPQAIEALGQRWEAYAASQGTISTGSQITDSHGRVDLPATSPTSTTSGDDTGIAWLDVVYGVLLGFALVALGGLGAMVARTHGRVAQS